MRGAATLSRSGIGASAGCPPSIPTRWARGGWKWRRSSRRPDPGRAPIAGFRTPLVYTLILIHACILMLGGHYTYARVPLGFWMQNLLHFSRNPYDRVGHLAQASFRRSSRAKSCCGGRRSSAVGSSSSPAASRLAVSACYEFVEWWSAHRQRGDRLPGHPGRRLGYAVGHADGAHRIDPDRSSCRAASIGSWGSCSS